MPQLASRAMLCSKHDTVVTVTGDLENDSLLQGVCPMGGETMFYETGGGPATPQAGVGGVHDPMHGVALAPAIPETATTKPTEWDAPGQDWSASPATTQTGLEFGAAPVEGEPEAWKPAETVDGVPATAETPLLPEDHPPLVPPV